MLPRSAKYIRYFLCLYVLFIQAQGYGQKIGSFQQSFGGSSDDVGSAVILLPDKGFMIAGVTKSYGSGGEDILLIRTDSLGKKIWSKTFGGNADDGVGIS